jgi:hypothetical protein
VTEEQKEIATSPEVTRVLRALRRLAKIWPKNIYLFGNNGSLDVMLKGDQNDGCGLLLERVDGIEADGGDWGEWDTE